jgi:hypothetical protein
MPMAFKMFIELEGIVHDVDASKDPNEVFSQIVSIVSASPKEIKQRDFSEVMKVILSLKYSDSKRNMMLMTQT